MKGDPERTKELIEGERRGDTSHLVDLAARGALALDADEGGVRAAKGGGGGGGGDDGDEVVGRKDEGEDEDSHLASLNAEIKRDIAAKIAEEEFVDPLTSTEHGLFCKLRFGHTLGVYACEYSHDGKHILSCSHDGVAIIWDINRQLVRKKFTGHVGPINCARYIPLPTNDMIATGSTDTTVRVWDRRSARCLFTFRDQLHAPVRAIGWSPEGKFLAAAGDEGKIFVWDAETAVACADDPTLTNDAITMYAISEAPIRPDGA